jgi:phage-related tail protein
MDDETRKRFDALGANLENLGSLIGTKFERLDQEMETVFRRLDAIVIRLEEADASHDRLMGKVDRLSVKIDQLSVLARAGEEAMTSLDALSKRVAKLEAARRGDN